MTHSINNIKEKIKTTIAKIIKLEEQNNICSDNKYWVDEQEFTNTIHENLETSNMQSYSICVACYIWLIAYINDIPMSQVLRKRLDSVYNWHGKQYEVCFRNELYNLGIIKTKDDVLSGMTLYAINSYDTTYKVASKVNLINSYAGVDSNVVVLQVEYPCQCSYHAFSDMSKLEQVSIRNWQITNGLFENCSKLENVVLKGVNLICDNAFKDCTSLRYINLEDNDIEEIGSQAFENCTSLKEINLPATLKTIEGDTFKGCNNLESVSIECSKRMFLKLINTLQLPTGCILYRLDSNNSVEAYTFR